MKFRDKIVKFIITLSLGVMFLFGGTVSAQDLEIPEVKKDTVLFRVADKEISKKASIQENPFNPLMGFLPLKNNTISSNRTRIAVMYDGGNAVPYFKPEIFVERKKPKLAPIVANYVPAEINLKFIPVNDTIIGYWEKENKFGLDVNQISFVNWSAGGDNSISGLLKTDLGRKYIKGRLVWDTNLSIRYGLNKQKDRETRKTDDVLDLNSTFGYKSGPLSDWYYTTKMSFKTQFTDGFSYPNIDQPISKWMAPAYLFLGVGAEYSEPISAMKFYVAPLTLKSTFVLDETLSNQGAFGVEGAIYDVYGNLLRKGKKSKNEFGILISNEWKKEIYKNIKLEHKLSLYTDYAHRFGNIDIEWQLKLDMKVNDYVKANIGFHLIYDDDIKNKREVDGNQIIEGPRVQFKQLLGVGLSYSF